MTLTSAAKRASSWTGGLSNDSDPPRALSGEGASLSLVSSATSPALGAAARARRGEVRVARRTGRSDPPSMSGSASTIWPGVPLSGVPREREELRDVLPSALVERADGEVEDLHRIPAAERYESVGERLVIAAADANVRRCPMDRLEDRRHRIVEGTRARSDGRSFAPRMGRVFSGRGTKFRQRPAHDPVPVGNRTQDVVQLGARGHQNSSGVGVEHPVGAELGTGKLRHPRDPLALAEVVGRPRESGGERPRAHTARGSRS